MFDEETIAIDLNEGSLLYLPKSSIYSTWPFADDIAINAAIINEHALGNWAFAGTFASATPGND